jgi:hypothetical protein
MPLNEAPVTAPNATREEAYKLVINQTLQSGESFSDLRQSIDGDGDFVAVSVYGSSTGAYSVKFRDAGMKDLSSAEISNVNSIGTAQFPVPFGGIQYPSLGQISFAMTNLLAGANTIQIVIEGLRLRKSGR